MPEGGEPWGLNRIAKNQLWSPMPEGGEPWDLNRIAKISYDHLFLREESLGA